MESIPKRTKRIEAEEILSQNENQSSILSSNAEQASQNLLLDYNKPKPKKRNKEFDLEAREKFKEDSKALKQFVGFGMEFLAKRMPNPIPVSELETNLMTLATDRLLDKYKEKLTDKLPELMGIGALGIFVLPRIAKPKEVNA